MALSILRRLPAYARLAAELRTFLREPLTPASAERVAVEALGAREARLVSLLGRMYRARTEPYWSLLQHAGVDESDSLALVRREGVEGALRALARAGVHLSLDELRGRVPIRRGSLTLSTAELSSSLAASSARAVLHSRSSGSRSSGTRSSIRVECLVEESALRLLALRDRGHAGSPVGLWLPILPGSAGIKNMLRYAKMGRPPSRWFSHAPVDPRGNPEGAWLTGAVIRLGRLYGVRLPEPELTPMDQAETVAEWLVRLRGRGSPAVLGTYVSSAVRVAQAATRAGSRLDGTLFVGLGEPLTAARAAAIRRTGADVTCTYAMSEAGTLATGCASPSTPDDMHVLLGRAAFIQQPRLAGDRSVDALLLTALSPYAPRLLLNVETGDTGTLERRPCDCTFPVLGYDLHLSNVISYEKFTGEGMTYDASDLARVVEETLPARFGGVAGDYQAVAEEGRDGLLRLTVLVSPSVGDVDEGEVIASVQAELRRGPAGYRLAELVWKQAGLLQVRRAEPTATPGGKLLPFHLQRPSERPEREVARV